MPRDRSQVSPNLFSAIVTNFAPLSNLLETEHGAAMEIVLHKVWDLLGADVKTGSSPPSAAEKVLQKDIDKVKTALGKPVRKQEEE